MRISFNFILALSTLAVLMLIPQATNSAGAPASGVSRNFSAETTALDLKQHTVTLLHAPSGYTLTAKLTDKTHITRNRYMDPDEVPDGSILRIWAGMDVANKRVMGGGSELQPATTKDPLVAEPEHNMITGKVFREKTDKPGANGWATRDKKAVMVLQTQDGARWSLISDYLRPPVRSVEPGKPEDLQPGRAVTITVLDRGGQGELLNAVVDVWPKGAEFLSAFNRAQGGGPSGLTAAQLTADLQAARGQYAKVSNDLARLMPVRLQVVPQLALKGEPVVLEVRALASKQPNPKATIFPDYFHTGMKDSRELSLDWKQDGTEAGMTVFTAHVKLPSDKVGQYLIQWQCDIGGDIAQYSRSYAVCDNQSAVCLFQITSPGTPHPEIEHHKLHVPFDFWEPDMLKFSMWANAGAPQWAERSRRAREFGDNPDFLLECYSWGAAQVRKEPAEVQRLSIQSLKEMVSKMGYTGAPISFWSYSMGNYAYRLAQDTGGLAATALCTESHIDGSLEINHWGKPERPYFMSRDDFRKSGPGGPEALVAFSQVQRHTWLARHFFCDYNIEPGNGGINTGAAGRGKVYDELAFSRLLDFYDALFQMTKCQKTPFYITLGEEFNGERPGAAEGNKLMLRYAAQKARTGNVVFATTQGVADFYQRHYTATPESTCYFHDYWAGYHVKDKPDLIQDVMTMEGGQFYALALGGQILPENEYDYTAKWEIPDFGNENIPRRLADPSNYMLPGKYKYEITPRTLDTRPFQATRQDGVQDKALTITVTVQAQAAQKNLALALWNIPRQFQPGEGWFRASQRCRFVPVVAPYTDNLNGFLVADVQKGQNVFTVRFTSPARNPQVIDFQIGSSVRGKIFNRGGVNMAYLWTTGPWPATLNLDLPAGQTAQGYVTPEGVLQECKPGKNTFVIPQEQWMRLVGLTRDEILNYATAAHE